jgi:hypothetical protein
MDRFKRGGGGGGGGGLKDMWQVWPTLLVTFQVRFLV